MTTENNENSKNIEEITYQFHHDRIFLNNPVIMQGMGLAPLIAIATTVENALMMSLAVILLLTPTRIIACLLFSKVTNVYARVIGYATIAALVYIPMYYVMDMIFSTQILLLGIYLPMLVVEPFIIYRFGRVPEPFKKAVFKGVRITIGYIIVILLVGLIREIFGTGEIFGIAILDINIAPLLALPAGGFFVVGILCAAWRAIANRYSKYKIKEELQKK